MIDYKDPKAVLEICEKATPGPWKVSQMDDCFIEPRICLIPANGCYDYEKIPSNADLIALSREALPYWVAEAERLRVENEKLWKVEKAALDVFVSVKSRDSAYSDEYAEWFNQSVKDIEKLGRALSGLEG